MSGLQSNQTEFEFVPNANLLIGTEKRRNHAIYMREWSIENREKTRLYKKNWKEKNKEKLKEIRNTATQTYRDENREKNAAQRYIYKMVRAGKIIRATSCSVCGTSDGKIEAHHADYSKRDLVTWVCRKCHEVLHYKWKEDE